MKRACSTLFSKSGTFVFEYRRGTQREIATDSHQGTGSIGDGMTPMQSWPHRGQRNPSGLFVPFISRRCGCLGFGVTRRNGLGLSLRRATCLGRLGSWGKPKVIEIGRPAAASRITSGSHGGMREEPWATPSNSSLWRSRLFRFLHQGQRQKTAGRILRETEWSHVRIQVSK
jgi:hypothetical protein